MTILNQLAARRPQTSFRPTSVRALFVLRLARKLGEPAAAAHFADLARKHSDETLLLAYSRILNHGHPPRDLGRAFHDELANTREQDSAASRNGNGGPTSFVAVRIERRRVAVAVFVGTRLDFHDIRHLRAEPDKANASAISLLTWVVGEFGISSAAVERLDSGDEIRRAGLYRAVLTTLREDLIPVWEISRAELFDGYSYPPLSNRAILREAAHNILWPSFNNPEPSPQEIDAAALGLYVQTERLFWK
jgi:hypothetical protein